MTAISSSSCGRVVGADLGAEPVLERRDDPAAVGVVLGVRAGHDEHVERQPQDVAADLDVALLHHVEHRDLDALGEVGQLVDRDDAAVAARDQPEVDRLRVAERAALGHLHRVHVADQVGDAGVRRGQLLGVPLVAVPPLDRQVVAELGGPALRLVGDRLERVLAELGAGDDRRPLVEQADQRAQQPGLALAALAEQHDVVAGDQRPLELRDDGVLEAVQPRPRVAALAQRGEQVVADLGAQGAGHVAGGAELADGADGGCSGGSRSHSSTLPSAPTTGQCLRFAARSRRQLASRTRWPRLRRARPGAAPARPRRRWRRSPALFSRDWVTQVGEEVVEPDVEREVQLAHAHALRREPRRRRAPCAATAQRLVERGAVGRSTSAQLVALDLAGAAGRRRARCRTCPSRVALLQLGRAVAVEVAERDVQPRQRLADLWSARSGAPRSVLVGHGAEPRLSRVLVEAVPAGPATRYDACCGRLHRGAAEAETAEELMRSRYAAYAVGDLDYVWRTWHPRTRPRRSSPIRRSTWTGPAASSTASRRPRSCEVEFEASYDAVASTGVTPASGARSSAAAAAGSTSTATSASAGRRRC